MIPRRLRRRPFAWFVAASLLALLAALTTVRVAARGPVAVIVVAREDIAAGTPAASAPIEMRSVRAAAADLTGMIRHVDEIAGRRFAVAVAAGEPITQAGLGGDPAIAPRPLAAGERAISIPAAAAGAALPALVPGARVDITAPSASGAAAIVVRNGEVIARQENDPASGTGSEGGVLLRVREEDAVRLSGAVDGAAGIRILIRPFDEAGEESP